MHQKKKKNTVVNAVVNTADEWKWARCVVYLGVFLLMTVFPLVYHNYYYDILDCKYMFYYCTVLVMTVGVLAAWGIPVLRNGKGKDIESGWKKEGKEIRVPDICMALLLLTAIISTLQSDFKYESVWGNEGRLNGLFLWLIYGLAYLMITRLLKFRSNLLDFFLIAGILACLFGITDYFQMDLLHFKVRIKKSQINEFVSTMGNVNVYTAYVGMLIGAAMTLFATSKDKIKSFFYYTAVVITFTAMIMGRSDNGFLAVGALFAALPFYLFRSREGIRRYFVCIATLLSCLWLVGMINRIWPGKVVYLDSAFGMLSRSAKIGYGMIAAWLVVLGVYFVGRNQKEDPGRGPLLVWSALIGLCVLTVLYLLFDANIAGHGDRYGSLSEYLVFSDSWGTDRGFVWKLAMNHFKEFSVVRKLFGYGPDTFGILTHYNDFDTMVEYNNTIFESAHNEYIHYLLTIGFVGVTAYVSLLITSCYSIVKKCSKNPYAMAIVFAVLAYAVQASVNIAQPIITPIMFTLLMMGLSIRKQVRE